MYVTRRRFGQAGLNMGAVGETVAVTAHNAAQTWARVDDEVVFEAACECGWHGPDRAQQDEAIHGQRSLGWVAGPIAAAA